MVLMLKPFHIRWQVQRENTCSFIIKLNKIQANFWVIYNVPNLRYNVSEHLRLCNWTTAMQNIQVNLQFAIYCMHHNTGVFFSASFHILRIKTSQQTLISSGLTLERRIISSYLAWNHYVNTILVQFIQVFFGVLKTQYYIN